MLLGLEKLARSLRKTVRARVNRGKRNTRGISRLCGEAEAAMQRKCGHKGGRQVQDSKVQAKGEARGRLTNTWHVEGGAVVGFVRAGEREFRSAKLRGEEERRKDVCGLRER